MATSAQSLSVAIEGLWRKRSNDLSQLTGAARIAAAITQNARGEYQFLSTDLRKDLRRPATAQSNVTEYTSFPVGNLQYSYASTQPRRHVADMFMLPSSVIAGLQDANSALDVAKDAEEYIANDLLTQHLNDFLTAAAGLAAPAAGALDLSVDSVDLNDYFRTVIREISLTSTQRPNFVYMSPEVHDRLISNDTIQEGTALAIGADTNSIERRTGFATDERLRMFFRSLGLEVIVEHFSQINLSGAGEFVLGADIVIGRMDPRGGTFQTFVRKNVGKRSGTAPLHYMVNFLVQDTVLPAPQGIAVAGDGFWEIQGTNVLSGRLIDVTLA
jgi:hypothetical protein